MQMMTDLIHNFFSVEFIIGLVVGFVTNRGYQLIKVWWLDRHEPLPGGGHRDRRAALAVDLRYFAGVIAAAVALWSVYQTQANANEAHRITSEARTFAAETQACQAQLILAIKQRADITAIVTEQSNEQRDALANWLHTLLQPPENIAALRQDDPVRQQWAIDVTTSYFNQIQRSQVRQAVTDAKRQPLPDPYCPR